MNSSLHYTISSNYLTIIIIPRAKISSESIAHEAEGRMGYNDSEAMNVRGIIVLVINPTTVIIIIGQKSIKTKLLSPLKAKT